MSSLTTAYLCEPEALQSLTELFARSLKAKPEEWRIIEFMRCAVASPNRIKIPFLVLKGLSRLLASEYADPQLAINLLRECLRKVSRETLLLIEAKKLAWNPTNRGEVLLDGVRLPVSSIDVEDTLKLQEEYNLKGFVKVRL
jgi:hypothetical protein